MVLNFFWMEKKIKKALDVLCEVYLDSEMEMDEKTEIIYNEQE